MQRTALEEKRARTRRQNCSEQPCEAFYSTVRDDEVYIPGFEIVRKDRKINGRNGGGVCTYVRTNLNYRIRNDLNNDLLECLFVEISKPRSTAYCILGLDWTRLVKRGLVKRGLVKRGLVKRGLVKRGLVKRGLVKRRLVKRKENVGFINTIIHYSKNFSSENKRYHNS